MRHVKDDHSTPGYYAYFGGLPMFLSILIDLRADFMQKMPHLLSRVKSNVLTKSLSVNSEKIYQRNI